MAIITFKNLQYLYNSFSSESQKNRLKKCAEN